jgi:hypothetical protein
LWLQIEEIQLVKAPLLVLCAFFANQSLACSCIKPPDISSQEQDAELVVLAKFNKRSPSIGSKKYVFTIVREFKGTAAEQIVVRTPRFEVSCGLRTQRSLTYVLFVYRENGKLTVDRCSSWPLTSEYAYLTNAFNEFYKLTGTEVLEPRSNDQLDDLGK